MYEVHLIIRGKVQGVWYRKSACEKAREFGVSGWVKNLPDGSIEIVAQGEKKILQSFIEWCSEGSKLSEVRDVTVRWQKISQIFADFTALR